MALNPKAIFKQYAKFIATNAETCSDIEMMSKYFGYFISGEKFKFLKKMVVMNFYFAGKLSDGSNILTEAMLSFSNLLVIFNDQIIQREVSRQQNEDDACRRNDEEHRLKLFLTILDNVEVLIEITSKKMFGDKRKFIVIFIIQAVKCIGRLVLLVKYKNRISQTPAIEYVDRKNVFKQRATNPLQPELNNETLSSSSSLSSITLKLKRSGKTIRKVSNAPPIYTRNFRAPETELEPTDRFGALNHTAIKNAEIVYVLKPMLHLGSIAAFGYKSWKSYLVSLFLDTYSIYSYYKYRNYMTPDQKRELSRRCVNMLLYILRSPFYDKYSADKIDSFMRALNNVPFARFIVEPYRQYIPNYQDTYFYMFSN
jgi:peroxin-16